MPHQSEHGIDVTEGSAFVLRAEPCIKWPFILDDFWSCNTQEKFIEASKQHYSSYINF